MLRRRGVACCFFGNWNLQPCENQLRSKIPFSRGGDFQASKQEQVETLKVLYLLFVRRGFRGRAPRYDVRVPVPCTPLRARPPRWTHEWTLRRATAMRLGPAALLSRPYMCGSHNV